MHLSCLSSPIQRIRFNGCAIQINLNRIDKQNEANLHVSKAIDSVEFALETVHELTEQSIDRFAHFTNDK